MDQKPVEKMEKNIVAADEERRARHCEACWMGEYKETGYRYCMNPKCPQKPGTRK